MRVFGRMHWVEVHGINSSGPSVAEVCVIDHGAAVPPGSQQDH